MKRLLIFGLLAGFAGTLAAAHFVPWVSHVRIASQTSVVANGGRAEQFAIRLPADRIHAVGPEDIPLRSSGWPMETVAIGTSVAAPLLEHFKVRDSLGNVVGVASRHWVETPEGPVTAWALAIPSRGTLILSAGGEPRGALESALAARGFRPGVPWSGDVEVTMAGGVGTGRAVAGSREFAGLTVEYSETWLVAGVSEGGEVRATIQIDTVGRRE